MTNTISIYTTTNWLLIKHLWPNGLLVGKQYSIVLDEDELEHDLKIRKLDSVSPFLAELVDSHYFGSKAITFNMYCALSVNLRSKFYARLNKI